MKIDPGSDRLFLTNLEIVTYSTAEEMVLYWWALPMRD